MYRPVALALAFLALLPAAMVANLPTRSIEPAELPDDFAETVLAGLNGVTAMTVAPDGRVFLCEQTGALRVVKEGKLLAEPFVRLPVDSTWERGLLGVTLAPQFPKTPHVYVCYVALKPHPHHRVSRFKALGDRAEPGSEVILFKGDDQRKLGGVVPAGHQGGPIAFGPDGKLYVAIGEQTAGNPSQDLGSFLGKLLRLEPDGSIPADNPLLSRTRGRYGAIWALGLRNPYGLAFQARTGRLYINDVGGSRWEEINEGKAGGNYGWPLVEGLAGRAGLIDPVHAYDRGVGRCITGGVFYDPHVPHFPDRYRGKYFFADYMDGWVRTLGPDRPDAGAELFARGLRGPVALALAPDGSLYVLERNAWVKDGSFRTGTGLLRRILYAPRAGEDVPRLKTQPAGAVVAPGQKVVLRVEARGAGPLSYQWQADGKPVRGSTATLSVTAPAAGATCYRCLVKGPGGTVRSRSAIVRVEPLQAPGPMVRVLPGLHVQTCEIAAVADVERLARAATGVVPRIEQSSRLREDRFAVRLRGLLRVPADGVYTLTVRASGPTWLSVAGRRVGVGQAFQPDTGRSEASGTIGLRKGLHELALVLAHLRGTPGLRLGWSGPGVETGEVPAAALCRPDPSAPVVPLVWPAGGTYSGPVVVSLHSPSGAPLRYTTDGVEPTERSARYRGPFRLERSASVRVVAMAEGGARSSVVRADYTITGTRPYGLGPRRLAALLNVPRDPSRLPGRLSETGLFRSLVDLTPADGLIGYEVNSPLWSDGAAKRRWIALPEGGRARFAARGEWGFPAGTVFVKHFELDVGGPKGRRLETRVLVADGTGRGYGATYRWRPDGRDADLLPDGLTEQIDRGRTWTYPSRSDCLACHNATAGFVLGVNTRQINRTARWAGITDNQLRAWNHAGLFAPALEEKALPSYSRLAAVDDDKSPLEVRVRSYLDANCAFCHRPGGSPGAFDARFDTPMAQQKWLTAPLAAADLGLRGVRLVTAGDPGRSMLYVRMKRRRDVFNMPPLASTVADEQALTAVAAWIKGLATGAKK
jgi:uncharacterized repeat protein (TIGR03806 family)